MTDITEETIEDAATFFLPIKKKVKKDKKKFGFNASAVASELETKDIVYNIVEQLSITSLKGVLADSAGCPRRIAALTFLHDLVFVFGTSTVDVWPTTENQISEIIHICCPGRHEISQEHRVTSMVACWREWGAMFLPKETQQKKKQQRYEWDLDRTEQILSLVKFYLPDDNNILENGEECSISNEYQGNFAMENPPSESFIRCIPRIVEAVAFARDKGISTNALLKEAQVRLTDGSVNPGTWLRSISEIIQRKSKYFLANEVGYNELILAGYMSQQGVGKQACRVLEKMLILFNGTSLPCNHPGIYVAMKFCGCSLSDQPIVLNCWRRLSIADYKKEGKTLKVKVTGNIKRMEEILSHSLVTPHLDPSAEASLLQNIPIMDETSLQNLH